MSAHGIITTEEAHSPMVTRSHLILLIQWSLPPTFPDDLPCSQVEHPYGHA